VQHVALLFQASQSLFERGDSNRLLLDRRLRLRQRKLMPLKLGLQLALPRTGRDQSLREREALLDHSAAADLVRSAEVRVVVWKLRSDIATRSGGFGGNISDAVEVGVDPVLEPTQGVEATCAPLRELERLGQFRRISNDTGWVLDHQSETLES
jgi:hypothetical protein